MIITNVCLLLEALSIVICLHHLYGEKFRLDIATVSFLSVDMIIMAAINYFGLPKTYTMVIYPFIILYCGIKFGFKWKDIAINIILSIVFIGVNQILMMAIFYYILDTERFVSIKLMIVNIFVLLNVFLILPHLKVNKLIRFLKTREKILIIAFGTACSITALYIVSYKKTKAMELDQALLLFISIIFIFILSGQLNRYKIKAKEIEIELRMHQLYSESFQGLIDNIRLRQHEFDNHINAIYSQHFSYHTYDELVEAQRSYCKHIVKDNRFNKLLVQDNSVIRGFLYTRFLEIDKKGIDISYQVSLNGLAIGMPVYKIIEILGNLLNNAVEALEADEGRNRLHVSIVEADTFFIEVKNESPYITYDLLSKFFGRDYSKKGENRGLGLYNVKQICEEYGLEVSPECTEEDGINWLAFKVWKAD